MQGQGQTPYGGYVNPGNYAAQGQPVATNGYNAAAPMPMAQNQGAQGGVAPAGYPSSGYGQAQYQQSAYPTPQYGSSASVASPPAAATSGYYPPPRSPSSYGQQPQPQHPPTQPPTQEATSVRAQQSSVSAYGYQQQASTYGASAAQAPVAHQSAYQNVYASQQQPSSQQAASGYGAPAVARPSAPASSGYGSMAPAVSPAMPNGVSAAPVTTAPTGYTQPQATPQYAQQQQPQPQQQQQQMAYPSQMQSLHSQQQIAPQMQQQQHAVDQITGQMKTLMSSSNPALMRPQPGQPVGIIGAQLPISEMLNAPISPIQPVADPEYFRVTLNKIPKTASLLQKTRLTLGVTVTPYPKKYRGDAKAVPVIDGPIVRCRRCRTYLNPFVELMDAGSKWRCNLCFLDNEFPANYDYDVATQQYIDRNKRAELHYSVYDFIAPTEYMVRPPQPPVYLFLIDASFVSVNSGLFSTTCRILLDSLDQIPNTNDRTKVGVVTFDSSIHFYRLASGDVDEPKMMIVSDLDDIFLPSAEDLLVSISDAKSQIENLLRKLPSLFASTQNSHSALGPALKAAITLLNPIGGKVVLVQAALPDIGEGKLVNRDDVKALGTVKENALLQPANSFYKSLATECSPVHICIDAFLFPSPYLDVATIACVSKYTGGRLFYYPAFNSANQEVVQKYAGEMSDFLSQEVGLEAVIRIRASQGLSLSTYHGSFFLRSTDLLSLPNVNLDHSYSAQIVIDEPIVSPVACFQTAVLHTSCHGERRIRVLNASFPVTDDYKEVFQHADVGSIIDLLSKMAAEKALGSKLEDSREALHNKMLDILQAVKSIYETGQVPQLMVPESLRLLPLLLHAIQKSPTCRGGSSTPLDFRSFYLINCRTLSVPQTLRTVYPFCFAVHKMTEQCGEVNERGQVQLPPQLRLSSEVFERFGVYLVDNGTDQIFWVSAQAHPELTKLIFGQPYVSIPEGKVQLPTLDNPWNKRLWNILKELAKQTGNSHPMTIIVKEDSQPFVKEQFLSNLIEDKMNDLPSYSAWSSGLRDKLYNSGR